jgi:hypothetical protein
VIWKRPAFPRYSPAVKPRFREGELVRIPGDPGLPPTVGVVDDVAGPNDAGTGWAVTVWVERPGRPSRSAWVVAEDELALQLHVVTGLVDSSIAATVAESIEHVVRDLVGHCRISIEAERHWADPYHYELDVSIEPFDDPVEALLTIADAGGESWLGCLDDGWRCQLWWSRLDEDSVFLVPEIQGAEVSFLPWDDPSRRPESERPLVAVEAGDGYDGLG